MPKPVRILPKKPSWDIRKYLMDSPVYWKELLMKCPPEDCTDSNVIEGGFFL